MTEETFPELKPCPFCGERVTMNRTIIHDGCSIDPIVDCWTIIHPKCGIMMQERDKDALAERWNRRETE